MSADFIITAEVREETLKRIERSIELVGPAPIDVVIVGADRTKLEIGDMIILKVSLPPDDYAIMREAATARAVTEPELIEVWAVPSGVKADELAYELSLAMLKRLVDSIVARASPELVVERARAQIVEGETLPLTLVRTLAVDVSASLAIAGRFSEAARLLALISSHPAAEIYRKFWDFVTTNFKFLPAYNWLLLMHGGRNT
jgi:hypothetical protein